MRELPDAPTLEVKIGRPELLRHDRWTAAYFEGRFRKNEKKLKQIGSVPLGNFIPEELPDGSKGITYGQVGARKLSPRGSVRYLQVINIRDIGMLHDTSHPQNSSSKWSDLHVHGQTNGSLIGRAEQVATLPSVWSTWHKQTVTGGRKNS